MVDRRFLLIFAAHSYELFKIKKQKTSVLMKKISFLAMMLAASVTMLTFFACGGDDNDGKYTLPTNMMGTWAGREISDSYNVLILTLFSNGTSNVMRLQNGETKTEESGGKWAYNSSDKTLVVGTSNGKSFHYTVSNFTGTSMSLQTSTTLGNVWTYNMTLRSSYNGGSSDDDDDDGGDNTRRCQKCGGTGKCSNHRSSDNLELYCQGSGICKPCGGSGQIRAFGLYHRCTYCNKKISDDLGNGECGFCGGSGDCTSCGGTGYK